MGKTSFKSKKRVFGSDGTLLKIYPKEGTLYQLLYTKHKMKIIIVDG